MSTAALKTSEQSALSFSRMLMRRFDFVVLAVALPLFIVAGWSLLGYAVAAGMWVVQAVVQARIQAKIDNSDNPRTVVGLMAGASIGRAWVAAAVILITGLFDNKAGLAAVVLFMVLFTIYFLQRVIGHYYDQMGELQ